MTIDTLSPSPSPTVSRSKRPSGRRLSGLASRGQFAALEARTLYSADLGVAGVPVIADNAIADSANAVNAAADGTVSSQAAAAAVKPATYGPEMVGPEMVGPDKSFANAARDSALDRDAAMDLLSLVNDTRSTSNSGTLEIVLIDSSVPELDVLRADFQKQIDNGRHLAVMVVDARTDGLQRVSQMLSLAGEPVSAIHIISHGSSGAFSLGASTIDAQTIEARSAELAGWSQYLSTGADILIYGCDVAANATGAVFVSRLGEITGADISASTDLTGAKALGGNWDLEYHSGTVQTTSVADTDVQQLWNHVLASSTSAEILVNQQLTGEQTSSALTASHKNIAVNNAGDIAVVWQDNNDEQVVVRLFHPDGSARTNEIVVFDPVAEGVTPAVDITRAAPVVAMRDDGTFVVSWVQRHTAVSDKIFAQRYTAEGIALGPRIDVDGPATNNYVRRPDISMDDSGGFIIAYQKATGSGIPDNGNYDVKVSAFTADGEARFTNAQVAIATGGFEGEASVAAKPDGSFIVAWTGTVPLLGTYGIFAQRMTAGGAADGLPIIVNTTSTGDQTSPSIVAADDGSFAVSFTSDRMASSVVVGSNILMQNFNANGSKNGSEQVVATTSEGVWNFGSSIALDPTNSNKMLVVWSASPQSDGSYSQILTRGYSGYGFQNGVSDITPPGLATSNSASVASNGNLVVVDYDSLPSSGVSPSYDVHLVSFIADTGAYQHIAPANHVPGTQTLPEDGLLALQLAAPGNAIQIADSDADSNLLSVELSIPGGTGVLRIALPLSVSPLGSSVHYTATISGTTLAFQGTVAELNQALAQLQFDPANNFNGSVPLQITTTELYGTALSDQDTVEINVTAVNDAPALSASFPTLTVMEGTSNVIGAPGRLQASDIDAAANNVTLSLTGIHGTSTVPSTGSMSITTIDYMSGPDRVRGFSLTGTLADINTALTSLNYQADSGYSGTDTLSVLLDDNGNTGSGGNKTGSASITVNILAADIAPAIVWSANLSTSVAEDSDSPLANLFGLPALSISDADAGANPLRLDLSVSFGALTTSVTPSGLVYAGSSTPVTGAINSATLSVEGSLSDLNNLIAALHYKPIANSSGSDALTITVNDLQGAAQSIVTETRTINVSAVNDAPAFVVGPVVVDAPEDTAVAIRTLFSGGTLSLSDVDAGSADMKLEVSIDLGTLTLDTTGLSLRDSLGTAFTGTIQSSANATYINGGTLSLWGSKAALDSALQRIMYQSASGGSSTVNLYLHVDDLGNTGAGPNGVADHNVAFNVSAVNDLPVISFSALRTSVPEDTSAALSTIMGSLQVNDPDAGSSPLLVTLSASKGTLSLDTDGLNLFDPVSGNAVSGQLSGSSISFKASQNDINAAMPQAVFRPASNQNGSGFAVTVTVDDLGNTGAPGAQSGPVSVTHNFSVSAVNDAPVMTLPSAFAGREDTTIVFSAANGNQFSISDPDGNVTVEVSLNVTQGKLSLNGRSGLNFTSGDGQSDSSMRFTGTLANINAALNGLSFKPDTNFNGGTSISMTAGDLGNVGSGGALSATGNVALTLAPVNDLPTVQDSSNFTLPAGATRVIDSSGLKTTDLESGPQDLVYTLDAAPAKGELQLNGQALTAGATFTQLDINNGALAYRALASSGSDQFKLRVRDADGGQAPAITLKVTLQSGASFVAGAAAGGSASSGSSSSSGSGSGSSGSGSSGSGSSSLSVSTGSSQVAAGKTGVDISTTGTAQSPGAPGTNAPGTAPAAAGAAAAPTAAANGATNANGAANAAAQESRSGARNASEGSGKEKDGNLIFSSSVSATPIRSDASRLLDAILPPMPGGLSQSSNASTPVAGSSETTSKAAEPEPVIFVRQGIVLPAQSPSIERIANDSGFQKGIEQVRDDVLNVAAIDRNAVASTIGVSASFTIGYILWLVRGGVLISSLLASLPAWRMVDPLPVLGSLGSKGKNDDDQSLEDLVGQDHDTETLSPDSVVGTNDAVAAQNAENLQTQTA